MKVNKVHHGVSFLKGLEVRYGEDRVVSSVDINTRQSVNLELVGEERLRSRIQDRAALHELQLKDMDINDSVEDNLGQICPNVASLDISFNLISSWRTVVHICKQFPKLHSLNIRSDLESNVFPVIF